MKIISRKVSLVSANFHIEMIRDGMIIIRLETLVISHQQPLLLFFPKCNFFISKSGEKEIQTG